MTDVIFKKIEKISKFLKETEHDDANKMQSFDLQFQNEKISRLLKELNELLTVFVEIESKHIYKKQSKPLKEALTQEQINQEILKVNDEIQFDRATAITLEDEYQKLQLRQSEISHPDYLYRLYDKKGTLEQMIIDLKKDIQEIKFQSYKNSKQLNRFDLLQNDHHIQKQSTTQPQNDPPLQSLIDNDYIISMKKNKQLKNKLVQVSAQIEKAKPRLVAVEEEHSKLMNESKQLKLNLDDELINKYNQELDRVLHTEQILIALKKKNEKVKEARSSQIHQLQQQIGKMNIELNEKDLKIIELRNQTESLAQNIPNNNIKGYLQLAQQNYHPPQNLISANNNIPHQQHSLQTIESQSAAQQHMQSLATESLEQFMLLKGAGGGGGTTHEEIKQAQVEVATVNKLVDKLGVPNVNANNSQQIDKNNAKNMENSEQIYDQDQFESIDTLSKQESVQQNQKKQATDFEQSIEIEDNNIQIEDNQPGPEQKQKSLKTQQIQNQIEQQNKSNNKNSSIDWGESQSQEKIENSHLFNISRDRNAKIIEVDNKDDQVQNNQQGNLINNAQIKLPEQQTGNTEQISQNELDEFHQINS